MIKSRILIFVLLIALFSSLNAYSQQLGDSVFVRKAEKEPVKTIAKKQGFKPKVSVSLGSSFSTFAPGVSAFGTYIMPEFTIPVNKKFAVRAGVGYSTLFTNFSSESSVFGSHPQSYGTVYVEGIYKLNNHVTISALGYKTFRLDQNPQKDKLNPHALDMSNQGVYINMNYKVNDKFEINAGFSFDNRNYNPYYNPAFGGASPFPTMNPGGFNHGMRGYSPF